MTEVKISLDLAKKILREIYIELDIAECEAWEPKAKEDVRKMHEELLKAIRQAEREDAIRAYKGRRKTPPKPRDPLPPNLFTTRKIVQ